MLSANKEKLGSFFLGSCQYKIPFFQRAYVWKEDNWGELWDDILEELAELKSGNKTSEHFIGTIIIKQTETEKLGALVYDLIDGQQRLTTVCLLLKALHDCSPDQHLQNWIANLLSFRDAYGNNCIRIIHSKVDTDYFHRIITSADNNATLPSTSSKIVKAYEFFVNKIKKGNHVDDIRDIVTIVLEKLPVIHMALSVNDDVQQIFDTINSLGVKLTAGELLKNYMFSFPILEPHYEEYWQNVFECDEETINFWNKDKTSGRVVRSTIELFLYSYLVISKESSIKLETLFKEYKQYLNGRDDVEMKEFANELKEYALIYQDLPDGEALADIEFEEHDKRFFHLMNELDNTTVFPLVLFLYRKFKSDKAELTKILRCLESYIVRRTVCRLTAKNYNNLFTSIMIDLKKLGEFNAEDFRQKLMDYDDESNRFPDDEEFERAFKNVQLINKYSKEILYCIALYQLNNTYVDNKRLSSHGFSVEHMMPKKWPAYWPLADATKQMEDERNRALLTLGNLTLVKGTLNSAMRNAAWNVKQGLLLKYSSLRITTDYISKPSWNEASISQRSQELYGTALDIWKR